MSQDSWIMKHLNSVYALAWLIGIVVLIVGFMGDNAIGCIYAYMVITVIGGILVLWAKKRLNVVWVYGILAFSFGFGFPIAVLWLDNKRWEGLDKPHG